MTVLLWIPVVYVIVSATEYAAHRWIQHSTLFPREHHQHEVLHHGRYYGRRFDHSEDPAGRYISVDLQPVFMLAATAPIWLTLAYFSHMGGAVLAVAFALHGMLWTTVHREMHEPEGRWFAGTRWYAFFRAYHAAHHRHVSRNFNVLCPLFDFIMGTWEAS